MATLLFVRLETNPHMFGLNICMFVWYRKDLNHNIIVEDTMGNKRTRQHLGEHSRASLAAIAAKRIQNTQCRRKNRAEHRKHQQRLILQSETQDLTFEHTSSSECPGNPHRRSVILNKSCIPIRQKLGCIFVTRNQHKRVGVSENGS